jgi:hypothetical protein
MKNKDPFYASFMPNVLWTLLGSRVRKPGRELIPKKVRIGSKTNETMHYSVREKMEEIAKQKAKDCHGCEKQALPSPSTALEDYEYRWKDKAWVWKNHPNIIVPEFPPPRVDDKNSMQAWLSGDWLQIQGITAVGSKIFSAEDVVARTPSR